MAARRGEVGGMTVKVGVVGARGRMGSEVCRAVEADPELTLTGAVDDGDDRDALRDAAVVVDFTTPDVVMDNVKWCIDAGKHVVVGTTGFDDARLKQVGDWLAAAPGIGALVAP